MNHKKTQTSKTMAMALDDNVVIKRTDYAPATFTAFRRKSEQLKKWLGDRHIVNMTATGLGKFLAELHRDYNSKTVNHYITILRQIFTRAVDDGLIPLDPMRNIKTCKTASNEPDPFLQHEIQALMRFEERHPIDVALITLGIGTGLRISELMALTVEAIDLNTGRLSIEMALVDKKFKTTKTRSSTRYIELSGWTLTAAQTLVDSANTRQSQNINVLKSDNKTKTKINRTLLAYSQEAKRPYASVDEYREIFFKPYCELVGVRYRGPSQFRHTYASQMLTAGLSVERIARKMGLTSTAMIYRHYGKWLTEDAPDYQVVEDTVLERCFHVSAKTAPATIAQPVQPNVRHGTDRDMSAARALDDDGSSTENISINAVPILPMSDMQRMALHQASLRWGGNVRHIV